MKAGETRKRTDSKREKRNQTDIEDNRRVTRRKKKKTDRGESTKRVERHPPHAPTGALAPPRPLLLWRPPPDGASTSHTRVGAVHAASGERPAVVALAAADPRLRALASRCLPLAVWAAAAEAAAVVRAAAGAVEGAAAAEAAVVETEAEAVVARGRGRGGGGKCSGKTDNGDGSGRRSGQWRRWRRRWQRRWRRRRWRRRWRRRRRRRRGRRRQRGGRQAAAEG